MRLKTYAGASFAGAVAIIYHAFNSRRQFYPAMLYLSTSKISLVLLLNMGFVLMCILWKLVKRLFLGSLREAEVERLNEQSWREVMEILFAITIFREEFSVSFLVMVTALLLIKTLHWLAQKRVEYIETTPTVPTLSHVRIVSFLVFLILVDCSFLYSSVAHLMRSREASVSLFFSFEYMILVTATVSTFLKYVFYVSDMLMEGQWERKAVYTFYLELIRDLLHLSLYLLFFLVIFVNYGLPLHLIRELYETFRNFKIRVADYIRYRRITSNMNDRFPDATPEELNVTDATCIICREEMVTAKKLRCGHLFHVHCLRSWLERQQTCPICRSLVVPPDNGATPVGTQGIQSNHHQHGGSEGSGAGSSSGNHGEAASGNNLSQHHVRMQAAIAAASVYGKSFVYPSPNAIIGSEGCALPHFYLPVGPGTEASSSESMSLAGEVSGNSNLPIDTSQGDVGVRDLASSLYLSQSKAKEVFLEHQIEVLQKQQELLTRQLDLLREQQKLASSKTENTDDGVSKQSNKGKSPLASEADDVAPTSSFQR
ncbi:ERAD-associated E3 ubiquitin-protein ligase HRD1B-like [Nymphaea colorata]|nr:ERAD-associated E3 ubiquitin-protein ligase HRD1B-like [Nymphaea colorata]